MATWAVVSLCAVLSAVLSAAPLGGCRAQPQGAAPAVTFTRVPVAGEGGPDRLEPIEGRVTGARAGQRLVLFARSGAWWVQPLAAEPFTTIQADGTWKATTHLGYEYAALLADAGYAPPSRTEVLPVVGAGVRLVAVVPGTPGSTVAPQGAPLGAAKTIQFSGYEWQVRAAPSDRGGLSNVYDPANAWTDDRGALHLRIARRGEGWSCAEVILTRSLGYGSYAFVVRDTSHLEPAAVLGLFTWDERAPEQRFREMAVEISRWGDPASRNGQFVVQPFYVPANVTRFVASGGVLTYTFRWEAGRVSFQTVRGANPAFALAPRSAAAVAAGAGEVAGGASRTGRLATERAPGLSGAAGAAGTIGSPIVAEHAFTAGVPTAGAETVRLNLYVYGRALQPLQKETEVVIEKFAYLP